MKGITMQYNYISAAAGQGKTEWAINHSSIINNQYNNNVLIVVPTVALCDEIENRSNHIHAIHSERYPRKAVNELRNVFREQAKSNAIPRTWVTTESSFMLLRDFNMSPEKWTIIKDEAFEPLTFKSLAVPDSKSMILSWFNFREVTNGKRGDRLFNALGITPQCPKTTADYDDILGKVHTLIESIKNEHVEVLVDPTSMADDEPSLNYSVFQKPSYYEAYDSVYFMSANFENTFLYHQWKSMGVKWVDTTPKNMRVTVDASRVRIHYWSETGTWSARRRDSVYKNTKKNQLEAYVEWFKTRESSHDYVYSINNDDACNVDLNGIKMPAICHGLNHWRKYTKFMTTASYNIPNTHEKVYQYYGTSTTDGVGLRATQTIYQQLMRTDLRNPVSTQEIHLYVPTLSNAMDLLLYLPEATICDLYKGTDGEITGVTGTLDTIPEVITDDNTTPLPFRYVAGTCVADLYTGELQISAGSNTGTCIEPTGIAVSTSRYPGSNGGHNKKSRSHPFLDAIRIGELQVTDASYPEAWKLSKLKRNEIKATLPVFVTGQYIVGARFGKSNLIGNNDILSFDIDGEDISNLQISKIFAGLEHLIYTTFSHNPNIDKRNLRVIVACDRTMTLSEHKRLMKHYIAKLEKYITVDTSKITPDSKFYWPHAESEITHVYKNKKLLCVDEVLMSIPLDPIIKSPRMHNLKIVNPNGGNIQQSSLIARLEDSINNLRPSTRSKEAQIIAGRMQYLPQPEKLRLYEMIKHKGVDEAALSSVKRYAKI